MTLAYLEFNYCDRIHLVFPSDVYSKKKLFQKSHWPSLSIVINECSINNEIFGNRQSEHDLTPSFLPLVTYIIYHRLTFIMINLIDQNLWPLNQSQTWGMDTPPLPSDTVTYYIFHICFYYFFLIEGRYSFSSSENILVCVLFYIKKIIRLYELFKKKKSQWQSKNAFFFLLNKFKKTN